jgi:ABC-type multidrug transport system fused ATPase/permease subunit
MAVIRKSLDMLRDLFALPEKTNTSKSTYWILIPYFRYISPVRKWAALALISGIVLAGLKMVIPYSSKIFIDNIVMGTSPDGTTGSPDLLNPVINSLQGLILLLIGVGIGMILVSLIQSYTTARFSEEYTFHLQSDLFQHVLGFPLGFYKNQRTGYLLARMNMDTSYLQYIFSQFSVQLFTQIVSIIFMFSILVALNAKLVLILLIFVPLFILVNIFFIRRTREIIAKGRDREAFVYRDLQEILSGIEVIKAHSAEEREYIRMMSTVRDAINTRIKNSLYSSLSTQAVFGIQGLALLVVFWFGGQDVLAGRMTLGDFVAFSAYIGLFGSMIANLISSPMQLQPALVSAARVNEIFALEPEAGKGPIKGPQQKIEGRITFQGVSFSYEGRGEVLSGIDIAFEPGTVTALIGRTGVGKTTLIYLLLRFYEPDKGNILLDGQDIRETDPRVVREHISYVSQDMFLFHASIEQNIRYSRPDASFEDIAEAAKQAGIHDEILQMPHGYATSVGERGIKLSAGQRQRVAIARAFLRNAPILILDEPTSHLDYDTEKEIEASLARLVQGKTAILVTHRQSLLSLADLVYSLENGTLNKLR